MAETLQAIFQGIGETDPEFLALAARLHPGPLFPVQRRALGETGLLRGESMLLISPTGTGKSLVADALALRAVQKRRVVLYLVSTRALARERHRQLANLLGPAGCRVVLSTRDERDRDEDILSGRVDLVVAVYEKARALFLRSAGFRAVVDVIVADEFQLLLDPDRGLGAGMLLRLWCARREAPQLLAMTAQPGPGCLDAAAQLGLKVLREEGRTVPLRVGELDLAEGVATWQCPETGERGRMDVTGGQPIEEDPGEALLRALEVLPRPVLLFASTRREAHLLARAAADRRPRRPDAGLPTTGAAGRGMLSGLLERGVAVHSTDLTRAQRQIVEQHLRDGRLDLCVATTTLADGINIGVRTVVVLPGVLAYAGESLGNLLGRAGRPGTGPGQAFVVRSGERRGVQPPATAPAQPRPAGLLEAVAFAISAGEGLAESELRALLLGALEDPATMPALLEQGTQMGLWASDPTGRIVPTEAGRILAGGGVDPESVCGWRTMLRRFRETGGAACHGFLALGGSRLAAALPLSQVDRISGRWIQELREELARDPSDLARYILDFLQDGEAVPRRLHQAAKGARVYLAALEGADIYEIAQEYDLSPGAAEDFLHEAAWLSWQLAELARGMQCGCAPMPDRLNLAEPVPASTSAPPPQVVSSSKPEREKPLQIVIYEGSTGTVRVNGRPMGLTRLQFRMLELLARHAGTGIPYERLETYVWPDAKVERQQVSYHKKRLEDRLREAGADRDPLIETVSSWGLRLVLEKEAIRFEKQPAPLLQSPRWWHGPINFIASPVRI